MFSEIQNWAEHLGELASTLCRSPGRMGRRAGHPYNITGCPHLQAQQPELPQGPRVSVADGSLGPPARPQGSTSSQGDAGESPAAMASEAQRGRALESTQRPVMV